MIGNRHAPPRHASRRAGGPTLLLTLILAVAPCGCSPGARPSDPDAGRKALQAALEAWKAGEKPEALAQREPSIHVADGDWSSGHSLRDFRLDDPGRLVGSDLNYSVALELKGPRGKVLKKEAVYAVTTDPRLMVLRQDD